MANLHDCSLAKKPSFLAVEISSGDWNIRPVELGRALTEQRAAKISLHEKPHYMPPTGLTRATAHRRDEQRHLMGRSTLVLCRRSIRNGSSVGSTYPPRLKTAPRC